MSNMSDETRLTPDFAIRPSRSSTKPGRYDLMECREGVDMAVVVRAGTIDDVRALGLALVAFADGKPAPLTVGAALGGGARIVEAYRHPDWWQFRIEIGALSGRALVQARWRHRDAVGWSAWGQPWEPTVHLGLPCRLVQLAEADGDQGALTFRRVP